MAIKQLPANVKTLIDIYQKAQADLIKTIAEKEAKGNVVWYQKTLLKQVNAQIKILNKKARKWTADTIPGEYWKGAEAANKSLTSMGLDVATVNTFAGLHKRAINILATNTVQDLVDANLFVGRQIQDVVRQVGLDVISNKIATGVTVKDAKRALIQRLVDEGINGIRDKRGRTINLASYAETVARSTTREATNTATLNQLTSLGYDLVKMSSHLTSCKICASLQGRVYSISGSDPRYPKLTQAYSGAHMNIHTRCRHVIMPYVETLADEPEKDREFSNRSFDIDPRSKKEIDSYNKTQKEKAKLRNDRRQWEKYKLALPDDTPKTFSGFRRSKQSNSEKWQELESMYRSFRQEV